MSFETIRTRLEAKLQMRSANQTIRETRTILNATQMHNSLNLPLLNFIQSKAWAISSTGIKQLSAHANSSLNIESSDFFELRPETRILPDGTALIHVHAALCDTSPAIYEKLGLVTRYATIAADIAAVTAQGAKRIVLSINSPGGTVSGLAEAAAIIATSTIPISSYCAGTACSAAYYLAAGTKRIVASPSAIVGNIGAIQSWANDSQFWQAMGIKWTALVNEGADLKSTFHLEPDEKQLAFLQESINQAGAAFKAHVQRHRLAIDPEVYRAGWYSGDRALALGLVDSIGTLESLLASPAPNATTITAPNSITKATLTKPPHSMQTDTSAAQKTPSYNGGFSPSVKPTLTSAEFKALSSFDKMTFSKTRGKIVDPVEAAPHSNKDGVLTRAGLAAMNPTERMAHFKAGGKLAD